MQSKEERKKALETKRDKLWCDYKTLLQVAEYYEKKANDYLAKHDEVDEELDKMHEEWWADVKSKLIRDNGTLKPNGFIN